MADEEDEAEVEEAEGRCVLIIEESSLAMEAAAAAAAAPPLVNQSNISLQVKGPCTSPCGIGVVPVIGVAGGEGVPSQGGGRSGGLISAAASALQLLQLHLAVLRLQHAQVETLSAATAVSGNGAASCSEASTCSKAEIFRWSWRRCWVEEAAVAVAAARLEKSDGCCWFCCC
ncbi:hypothetical protein TYRP_012665 [Tyrophagus putrescentiae]|nr:hypothetical protein TYRP_012665 [Tyrophagus putrescentiae]